MRNGHLGLLIALSLVVAACGAAGAAVTPLPCTTENGTGSVRALVLEHSGRPVWGAFVRTANWFGAPTDSSGQGCLTDVEPGAVALVASRVGFHDESATVQVRPEVVTDVTLTLRRADPPCCRLEGTWRVRFDMETPSAMHQHPAARSVKGLVVFSPRLPDPTPWSREIHDPIVRVEHAHTSVDFTSLFGGRVAPDVSRTVYGPGGETLFREVVGIVPAADSVELTFIPRMSHGSMGLVGRIVGDTIRGRWVQHAYCCGAEGRFEMHRVPPSPEADSLIASGLREYDRERRVAEAADSATRQRIGWLRVRVYDEAVGRHIAATFWTIREAHDPERYLARTVFAADTASGRYEEMEPGEWDTFLFEFDCGGEPFVADSTYVRRHGLAFLLTVRSGERVDRELRIDSRRIETEVSHANRGARRCGGAPMSGR